MTSTIVTGTAPYRVAFSPEGSTAYVTNIIDDTVSVIDVASASAVGSPINVGDAPLGVAFSPDATLAYVTNSGSTTVTHIRTGLTLPAPAPAAPSSATSAAGSGSVLAATGSEIGVAPIAGAIGTLLVGLTLVIVGRRRRRLSR